MVPRPRLDECRDLLTPSVMRRAEVAVSYNLSKWRRKIWENGIFVVDP